MEYLTQLFSYSANYRTPCGNISHVNGVSRGTVRSDHTTLEREATIRLCVDMCANPKRKVTKGIDGITVTRLEPIGPIEFTHYG